MKAGNGLLKLVCLIGFLLLMVLSLVTVGTSAQTSTPPESSVADAKPTMLAQSRTASPSKPILIRAAHGYPKTYIKHLVLEKIKAEWEQKTAGRVRLEIYPAGQLYNEKDSFQAVCLGNLELALVGIPFIEGALPDAAITSVPGLMDSYDHAKRVDESPQVRQITEKGANKLGLKFFGVTASGAAYFGFRKPVNKVEDVRSLKVRAPGVYAAIIKSWGGSAVYLEMGDLANALQSGMVDGSISTLRGFYSEKLHKLGLTYLLLVPTSLPCHVAITNKGFWDKLPADIRDVFEKDVFPAARDWSFAYTAEDERSALDALVKEGVTKIEPTSAEMQRFREATVSAQEKYRKEINPVLFTEAEKLR